MMPKAAVGSLALGALCKSQRNIVEQYIMFL